MPALLEIWNHIRRQLFPVLEEEIGSLTDKDRPFGWMGYKLHLDGIDGDLPGSGILSGAWVHDSQGAIPLAQMTAQRVSSLCDLMDSA